MVSLSSAKQNVASFNQPVYGLVGEYTLSKTTRVPYVLASMPILRVVKELKAFDQIPASLDATWSLRELYQRDIDYDRIKKEIVNGYLKADQKLKFFNALTFVFFPRNDDGTFTGEFLDYPGSDPSIPVTDSPFDAEFASSDAQKASFGGVQYVRRAQFGRLRWDSDRIAAIAVDGQHRLTALRKWWEDKNQVLDKIESQTTVPIIFLLLHPNAGFMSPSSKSLRLVARDIFTDLNKNAKKVDEAREIILDDRSLTADCVRRLVTLETATDGVDRLPLSLVRWQEANNRFDQSYFLNSLLHLHQLVEVALELNAPSDPLDPDAVKKYIQSLQESLGDNQSLTDGTEDLMTFYQKHYLIDESEGVIRPFVHLPESYLEAATRQFESKHKPYLIGAVMCLKPYRELLDYCRDHSLITGEFARYMSQPASHRRELLQQLEKRNPHWEKEHIESHIDKIIELKRIGASNETWAFKAIFQKALVRMMRRIVFENSAAADRLGGLDDVIAFVDELYEGGLLNINADLPGAEYPLWAFIGVHHNTMKIKVKKSVERAIGHVLLVAYYARRKHIYDKSLERAPASATELVRYFASATSQNEVPPQLWPGCTDAVKELVKLFAGESQTWAKMPDDKEKALEKKEKEGRARLALVLARLSAAAQ